LDIGDVENLRVCPAGKAGADRLPHLRARAVAAGQIARLAILLAAVASTQTRRHAVRMVDKAYELGAPLDGDTERLKTRNQQLFMLILGEDLQEGVRRHAGSQRIQRNFRLAHALDPEIASWHLMALGDDGFREVELPVELECAGLDGEGTRGRS